ncbi:DNA protecting protein DprA [Paenibacillus curdlanolyticus YK9]|uniref:DNA protecting protein DprA n=1 Tax=Paenibacillus curdlanolyticus YK9 TaxID=717606 RepID=E0I431_9BACL|nr:DNA-processing protein DprA [Paenibacillus curdlanolyticus]EFM13045.1 DNA protecting protein DprA [Paenibacillus curdlanolyticus YK9]
MSHFNKSKMLVMLHDIPGIGWKTIKRAVDARLWQRASLDSIEPWLSAGFRPEQANQAAKRFSECQNGYDFIIKKYLQRSASVITVDSAEYPDGLRNIHEPPWVLYAIGRLELLNRPAVSIVGTRTPTAYGRHMTEQLASGFAERGLTVVSGLAKGIDGIAHEASVERSGSTIAVLGTPIERIYPPQHASLFRRIAKQGLLLTEAPIGTAFHPGLFPLRNRIIAGLSAGTVVIEAADRSGSLITAEQAFSFDRELFALPGPVTSPKSNGTNQLLAYGKARVIRSTEDWFKHLPYMDMESITQNGSLLATNGLESLSEDERSVYEILLDQPCSADELHELTGMSLGHLHAVLINLCINRKVQQQHGATYTVI